MKTSTFVYVLMVFSVLALSFGASFAEEQSAEPMDENGTDNVAAEENVTENATVDLNVTQNVTAEQNVTDNVTETDDVVEPVAEEQAEA